MPPPKPNNPAATPPKRLIQRNVMDVGIQLTPRAHAERRATNRDPGHPPTIERWQPAQNLLLPNGKNLYESSSTGAACGPLAPGRVLPFQCQEGRGRSRQAINRTTSLRSRWSLYANARNVGDADTGPKPPTTATASSCAFLSNLRVVLPPHEKCGGLRAGGF